MELFDCPYLGAPVELTDEREAHIHQEHGELLPRLYRFLGDTLEFPHFVQQSASAGNVHLFSRWHTHLLNGKYVIIVVGTQTYPATRHFILTAYVADELQKGEILWSAV